MALSADDKSGRQIPFLLPHSERLDLSTFVLSSANQPAFGLITKWPEWPVQRALLTGPAGSGKSHLVRIWCKIAQAECVDARLVAGQLAEFWEPELPLAIDNGEAFAAHPDDLFHLINKAHHHSVPLLLSSELPALGLAEHGPPDLLSRLRASLSAELGSPDEDLLFRVFRKLFDDRQLTVDDGVIRYLIPRMERSLDTARRLVGMLDREALIERRGITRAFVSSVLARMTAGPGDS